LLAPAAIDLMGSDLGGLAAPAAARLDAKQVVAIAAIAGGDLVAPPAGFHGRLGKNQLGRHAAGAAGGLGGLAQALEEGVDMRRPITAAGLVVALSGLRR